VSSKDIITILATQKNKISYPVSSNYPGKNDFKSAVCFGQPMVAKGNKPELNHVSKTSSS
jgi:hypothetical protein